MNYTLHQLQVFLKVAQMRSITKASEELFLTQPAVSIQLRNFQDQFEIPLTEVIGRQLYVTDFGKEIVVAAEKILNEVYAINYKTLAYKGKLTGKLKISIVSTGKYIMPYFLSPFLNQNPGIDLMMDVTNKSKVIESLQANEIDFALVSVLPPELQVNQEVLMENKLYLIKNSKPPKASKPLSRKELAEMPLIFREQGSATRSTMNNYFSKYGISVRKKIELTSNEAVKQAVIAGLGYSIMPLIGLRNELTSNELYIIPATGLPLLTQWRIIWLKGKKKSPVAEAYINFLRENKSKILEEHFAWINKFNTPRSINK